MAGFHPSTPLTAVFVLLVLAVVIGAIAMVRAAAPADQRNRWMAMATVLSLGWLGAHVGVAASGVLTQFVAPPLTPIYLFITLGIGALLAFSPVGERLSALPLAYIVGLNAFRLPLEIILHELYTSGNLPVQMTWSGLNFDVLTGISAALLFVWRRDLPDTIVWAWNTMGLTLLVIVVSIALMSSPLPFRQFHNEPAVLLVFDVPFNWVPTVHVWVAWVSHLVIFRGLLARRKRGTP